MSTRLVIRAVCAMWSVPALSGLAPCAVLSGTSAPSSAAPPRHATASPANWLSPDAKPDAWRQDTERCRTLLDNLKTGDPLVQKHLPQIKDKTEMLRKVDGFTWKTRTAVTFLENLLEDLNAGRTPNVRYAGQGVAYPYWSSTMRRIEAIWVHVPPGYDPAKSYQVFLYYKCGGGIHLKDGKPAGGYRPDVAIANQTDAFHAWSSLDIQIKGRMGGHVELEEASAALTRDFAIDPDRVFLSGWSDGGFTAIWLAARYPHLVAGIAPNCGNWQYTNEEVVGLSNVPVLTVDGWGDGGYNNLQFLRWQMLRGFGADAACVWGQHGHSYLPYEDLDEFRYILDWAKTRRRNPYPRHVRYATWSLFWNRAYWVVIDRMADPALEARIEVQVQDGNRIEVQTRNVAAYRLLLNAQLVDPAKPLTVTTNGAESYAGPFKPDLAVELEKRPAARFVKDAAMPDEITALMNHCSYDSTGFLAVPGREWLAVKPTGADDETRRLIAKWTPERAKPDADVTDDDLARYHLFVYGGPTVNTLAARIAADLPVRFEQGRFTLGAAVYDQPTNCLALLHPNPLNPKKYVILYAFNDAAAFARNGFFGMSGESIWKFRSGDAVISGIARPRPKWGVLTGSAAFETRHLILGPTWRPDDRAPVGEAAKSFDYAQLLRLRADAIREAAGADVGVIWAHTPTWSRWVDGLPAGPITLNALATQDMAPEYVCVGQMRGSDLAGRRSPPAAWSLIDDRRTPGYQPGVSLALADIEPNKTYRVAMGYHGAPSYGANPSKMPKLFTWSTPEEFLADANNRILLQDLKQTAVQVSEAVAAYVEKRKQVAPRPVCFNLVDYIMNPNDNEFGACDWLHLGMDVTWRGGRSAVDDRYTLALGVRLADDPDLAPPRARSKQFADLDLADGKPIAFNLSGLDKHLPVQVATTCERFAVTMDREGKSFALAGTSVTEGRVGRAILLKMDVVNQGEKDVALKAVLSETTMRPVEGQTLPKAGGKGPGPFYAGYYRSVGAYQKPPVHEDAALWMGAEMSAAKLVAPNAGYNFGLVGLQRVLTVKAGQTLSLPLLFITLDRPAEGPDLTLTAVLDALKGDLSGKQDRGQEAGAGKGGLTP